MSAAQAQNPLKTVRHRAINAYRLLIIDEIGYLSMNREPANRFFQVIAVRYKRGSLMVTSHLPFGQWDATCAQDATHGSVTGSPRAPRAHPADCREKLPAQASTPGRHGSARNGGSHRLSAVRHRHFSGWAYGPSAKTPMPHKSRTWRCISLKSPLTTAQRPSPEARSARCGWAPHREARRPGSPSQSDKGTFSGAESWRGTVAPARIVDARKRLPCCRPRRCAPDP